MARQPVVGNFVPRGRRARERVVLRADVGVAVERAEEDGHLGPLGPSAAEQARSTGRAEGLRHARFRPVHADQLLAAHEPEALARHAPLRQAERARVLAAARAVAVAGAAEPRGDLEADAAAEAAAGQRLHAGTLRLGAPAACDA